MAFAMGGFSALLTAGNGLCTGKAGILTFSGTFSIIIKNAQCAYIICRIGSEEII